MPRRLAAGLALASGVLLALCLPRPGLCFLGWIGLAPLLYAVTRRPRREAFWLGLLAGFAFHGVAFYWIYSTCRFARVPAPAAILAWSALAGFEALAWGLSVWFGRWACEDLPAPWRALGWAVVWTAGAVIWERWTPRLPGDLLEYTQWRFLSLIQIASLAGPHALGFIVAFVNAALAEAWDRSQAIRADAGEASGLALALGLALASWGYGLVSLAARRSGGPSARVELLQPNIDQYQKWSPAYSGDILKVFDALLSLPRTKPPALIVWPESALPRLAAEGEAPAEAAAWSRRLGAFQIVGAVTEDGRGRRYNSALLLGPRGRLRATYHKRELVPFGEYVPFHWLGRFIGILDQLGGIQAGSARQPLFETPLGLAAASI
ncbi:MAG: apolipoprotein N-acyltransferase, partial [Elusimicrobia bacterium]|nr:apolipoprotein N-acyltransferase [Elusimicrobiota bacterium]